MTPAEKLEEFYNNEEVKRTFDLWVLNLDIKDGVGGRPDWFSLVHSLQFEILKILKK
jgi:hypothetical protein